MQLSQPRGKIIEKVLHNPDGQFVRAVFCVYEVHGRVKVRLLHSTVIATQSQKSEILALTGYTFSPVSESSIIFHTSIVSPFVDSHSIYFSGSKPRAPTF